MYLKKFVLSGSKISAFNEYIQRLSQILIFMSYAGSSEISAHTYITVHSYHLKDSRNKSAKRRWIFKLKADIFSRIPFNNIPKRYPSRFFLFFHVWIFWTTTFINSSHSCYFSFLEFLYLVDDAHQNHDGMYFLFSFHLFFINIYLKL